MRKLPGVESVDVSLERATTDVRLKPGNTVTLAQLRQIIKSNGFNAREAEVTVDGTLAQRSGAVVLEVTGTGTSLALENAQELAKRASGSAVKVTGRVETGTEVLKVRSVK